MIAILSTYFMCISDRYDFDIVSMEVDKDHIHMMIQFPPNTHLRLYLLFVG